MNNNSIKWIYIIGIIPVIWIGLLIAPSTNDGLYGIVKGFSKIVENPFYITWCDNSAKTILVLLLIYGMSILVYITSKRNYRKTMEYGSAKWGNARRINRKYMQRPINMNKVLTQNVSLGLDTRSHRRNLNTIVIGGSGAGKTRFYAKPNIMQCNTSFVILDPKGEILRDTGNMLKEKGYKIRVLDLINMDRSDSYNPFVYLQNDNDVQKLVTNLFKATTPKKSHSSDPFWDTAASELLLALIFYLWYEAPEEEQNFSMVLEMLRAGEVKEDDDTYRSPLDILFDMLELKNPNHIAVKYYRDYRGAPAKTIKSIQITLSSKLEKFNLDSLSSMTQYDEMYLQRVGEEKTALFAIIPDSDASFNFLVSILYTQLFQHLFYMADYKHGGRLPVPVHFVMDEFANVSLPNDFEKILSTMRSREVSVSIILQNLAQLKSLFEKDWESIVGNCDELLYLGGNEQSTHKFISESLGKDTIAVNTYSKGKGKTGSSSTSFQQVGRELMTPDEVRMLDNSYAILFIRGERPVMDLKYDIKKHPNINYSADGEGKPYIHGQKDYSIASIKLEHVNNEMNYINVKDIDIDYEIVSSEDIDYYFLGEENEKKNEKY
jgi:type IV secretion system protein VirD4